MRADSVLLIWLALIAVHDFRRRTVPNWLVLAGAAAALAQLILEHQPVGLGWTEALLGFAAGFGALLLFYATGVMGAGDVKFAGALGLWVGPMALLPIWIGGSLLAALHGILWLALLRWPVLPRLALMLAHQRSAADGMAPSGRRPRVVPYAAYLALATAVWLIWGRQS
ncbi:prepilin peptidase [Variovorax sp. Root434]|uniref:A24 family peptidase n=1 Tax=Variovorax sp. Root434 TaxID=1736536 RepID=UPI000A5D4E46|nr:A24 family peptidase [Variovorax sp. Root434]